ncbi:3-dehydroquinate synthase [Oscillochloris sp. ZM17-4]|uniref:3-dehydroquinate synthase n=1 Tax=Oscillochloris sp. ZM17-4 TaxID=2866714 RepID=UPI0021034F8C|nr:3-dehydroquinate synthase [Oscillochloris sp. ZM17-4]
MIVTTTAASYPVVVESGALASLPERLPALGLRGALWLVCDGAVAERYGAPLAARLRAAGHTVHVFSVPPGDASKSPAQLAELHTWMISGGVERRDAVLALGGGVVGDLAGFAAATILRGVAVVQMPTTLLSMVDAAVGGKTGINHPLGKNLIGAFHQPRLVLADTDTLSSLPPRALREGWAEVIKHGVIRDAALFEDLERLAEGRGWSAQAPGGLWDAGDAGLTAQLSELIRRAVAVKVEVVSIDEFEQGERITLNYGHTVGHAVEQLSQYGLLHGEAVAVGMHAEARIAQLMDMCDGDMVGRQAALLHAYGLETALPAYDVDAILALAMRDKKVQAKKIRWVLPASVGAVRVRDDVPEGLLRRALHA